MADLWLPGWPRVNLGLSGGPYDDTRKPKALWHTTEGSSVAGARRAFAAYPPHLCYDPRNREREQYIALNRHSYSLRGSESDDEYCIQVELVGFAGQSHTWPDEWLRNIGQDVIRPLRELAGVPDVIVWHGFRGADEGIVLASPRSPIRLTYTQLREFAGHLGHQHAPDPDEHWDPGRLNVARAIALSYEETIVTSSIWTQQAKNAYDAVYHVLLDGSTYPGSMLQTQFGNIRTVLDAHGALLIQIRDLVQSGSGSPEQAAARWAELVASASEGAERGAREAAGEAFVQLRMQVAAALDALDDNDAEQARLAAREVLTQLRDSLPEA